MTQVENQATVSHNQTLFTLSAQLSHHNRGEQHGGATRSTKGITMRHGQTTLPIPAILLAICIPTQDTVAEPNLVIAGGGRLPDVVIEEFRKLAGEAPRLVVIPTASREFDEAELLSLWKSRGFESVTVLHTRDQEEANTEAFAAPLRSATAVWFGGGSQQRIADAYLGTAIEKEVDRLMQRGGVVGGTSAGAAIQSKVMIAGGRETPEISQGLNLLSNAIVDQHFLARNRLPRLMAAVRQHPDRVGIGIDEGTAIVVSDGKARIVGRSYVLRIQSVDGQVRLDAFNSGESFETR